MKHALIHNSLPKTHACARLISAWLATQALATRFQLMGTFGVIRLWCGPDVSLETKFAGATRLGGRYSPEPTDDAPLALLSQAFSPRAKHRVNATRAEHLLGPLPRVRSSLLFVPVNTLACCCCCCAYRPKLPSRTMAEGSSW